MPNFNWKLYKYWICFTIHGACLFLIFLFKLSKTLSEQKTCGRESLNCNIYIQSRSVVWAAKCPPGSWHSLLSSPFHCNQTHGFGFYDLKVVKERVWLHPSPSQGTGRCECCPASAACCCPAPGWSCWGSARAWRGSASPGRPQRGPGCRDPTPGSEQLPRLTSCTPGKKGLL